VWSDEKDMHNILTKRLSFKASSKS